MCRADYLQVRVSFDAKVASPGDKVSITTRASPDSVVVLGVIDTSLTLLAEACKSVDTNNVSVTVAGTACNRPLRSK